MITYINAHISIIEAFLAGCCFEYFLPKIISKLKTIKITFN